MIKRALAVWLLLVAVALGYTLQGDGFSIEFPAEPKKTDVTVWELDHQGNSYRMSVDSIDSSPEQAMADLRAEFDKTFQFVSEEKITVDGVTGKHFHYKINGKSLESVMLVRGNKLYLLMEIVGGSADEAARVVKSLRLR